MSNVLIAFKQELIIVEGEYLTLHRPEKFKGILSVILCM